MTQIEIIGVIMFVTGGRPKTLAAANDINEQTMYRVIKGELRTKSVRQVISTAVNIPVGELWPEKKDK